MLKVGDVVRATELIDCGPAVLPGDIGVVCEVARRHGFSRHIIQFFITRGDDDGRWFCNDEGIELVEDTTTC